MDQAVRRETEGLMLAALPPGWSLLGRCRFGTAGPVGEASGCHALAHPGTGIVLVDIAPDVTPNAEARLRRALNTADFWAAFPGAMPVWHGRIELGEVRLLPAILAEGFSTLPPLTVPGKAAWVAAVQDALAEDPAWEVPGRSPRILPPPVIDEDEDAGPPPRPKGRVMLALAVAGIGGLALVGAMLLWGEVPPRTAESAPPAAPPVLAALPRPQQQPPEVAPPPLPRIEQVSLPELALPAAAAAPVPDQPALDEPALGEPDPQPPEAPAEAAAAVPELPLPPPPPRRVSAPRPPRIDPACSAALFRYQQGLPMSATDAAHVRNGCATRW